MVPKRMMVTLMALLLVGAGAPQEPNTQREGERAPAQTPAEILEVMSDSKLVYKLSPVTQAETSPSEPEQDPNRPILSEALFISVRADGTRVVMSSSSALESSPVSEHVAAAENAFVEKRWADARDHYAKALAEVPDSSQLMTFIGQTFGIEGAVDSAREWYARAQRANPFDYLTWFLIADLDRMAGDFEAAVPRAAMSHLLNRNNPRMFALLQEVYSLAEDPYEAWELSPGLQLSQAADGAVEVVVPGNGISDWMLYGMCKALWQYEPGYREKMLAGRPEPPRLLEERACLLATLVAAQLAAEAEPPSELSETMKRVERAAIDGRLVALAIYEIILVDDPVFAYLLSPHTLEELSQYVTDFH